MLRLFDVPASHFLHPLPARQRPRLLHPHHFFLLSSHFSAILPAAFLPFSSHQNDGFPSFFFQFGQAEILGGLMPRPPHFRCFLSFAACGFIHFIQNAKIASANSEKFFLKKRQNYQSFSEIIPFVQSGSLLLLATCSSFFPPSPAAIVCLIASWRLNSQSIYHFLFVKVLSYFINREVLGLFCGESAAHPAAAPLRGGICEEGKPSSALLPCMGAPPHTPAYFLA